MYRFHATQLMVDAFEEKDIKFRAVDHDTSECVDVGFPVDNGPSVVAHFISRDDDNDVSVRIYGLLHGVMESKRDKVMKACNECNCRFRFVKFCMDDDGDVNVAYDIPMSTQDDCLGKVAMEVFARVMGILDGAYPVLMHALWS